MITYIAQRVFNIQQTCLEFLKRGNCTRQNNLLNSIQHQINFSLQKTKEEGDEEETTKEADEATEKTDAEKKKGKDVGNVATAAAAALASAAVKAKVRELLMQILLCKHKNHG